MSSFDPHHNATTDTMHAVASVVIFDLGRQLVLLIRHRLSGYWQFPGGHQDPHEDLADTALREAREETGLEGLTLVLQSRPELPGFTSLPKPWLISMHQAPADPRRYPEHWHVDNLFVAAADASVPPTPQQDEVHHAQWWPITDVAGIPGVRQDIPVAVADAWQRVQAERRVLSS